MAQQTGLFGPHIREYSAGERGTIAYYPSVLAPDEAAVLFAFLREHLAFEQESMWMYDRTVDVPRLIARFSDERPIPPQLIAVRQRVEALLDVHFNALSVQLYRGENDSVAWHNDHRDELIDLPVIALVSLGATREMHVRSKERPRRTFKIDMEAGSLLVMAGRSQEFWEHTIPKARRRVGARISIALRQRR